MSLYAAILTVPRIGSIRLSIAPTMIKPLLKQEGKESKVFDINIDFHNNFSSVPDIKWNA